MYEYQSFPLRVNRLTPLSIQASTLFHFRRNMFFFDQLSASGRSLPIVTTACVGQVESKRLVSTDANGWSVAMQMSGQVHAITQLQQWALCSAARVI
ncbi:hypothetical protein [Pseudomonas coronafaciens]|uniref:hypothetical protein n=1 Tax=Pseudomonas coronafaciens TaxID=53409 RepID=UPI000EFEC27A|nr:hypothetical protein [Pseudomonas coronafaciens]RMV62220.1 hypothetical protein ALP06_02412 [Pseudomonas coronafaciens pv. atropurpurea]